MPLIFYVFILFVLLEVLSYYYIQYLSDFPIVRRTLFLGIFLHEFAHYLACKLTFAKVKEFRVGWNMGHVIHHRSKIPLVGDFFITLAPFLVGLVTFGLLFHWISGSSWNFWQTMFRSVTTQNWAEFLAQGASVLKRIPYVSWQFFFFIFATFNILATFVPSHQDYRNVFIAILLYMMISFFLPWFEPLNLLLFYLLLSANILIFLALLLFVIASTIKSIIFRSHG